MPNPENVIGKGNRFRTNEEATINGRKGGQASARKRREQKEAREIAKMVLGFKPDIPDSMLETMKRMGMGGKGKPDMRLISTLAITQKAMKGDRNSYAFLLELAGEYAPGERPVKIDADSAQDVQSLADLINNPADARTIDTILSDDTAPT